VELKLPVSGHGHDGSLIVEVQSRAWRGGTGEEDMFATIIGNHVYVTLSRRNLHQLAAALDGPATRHGCLSRRAENGVSLVVQVEDDSDHYEGRDPGQGAGKVAS
jgi:hypothetical protein